MTPSSASIICENGSQNMGEQFTYDYWFMVMVTTKEQPDWRLVCMGGRGISTLSPSTWPYQHLDVLTNPRALLAPLCRGFNGDFIM